MVKTQLQLNWESETEAQDIWRQCPLASREEVIGSYARLITRIILSEKEFKRPEQEKILCQAHP